MLPRIQALSPLVAERIAAGEVVLHPASVVKELVENSLDAGANDIRVALDEGGLRRIEVADNGHGMHADDLPLALTRHATSKIRRVEDLENLSSLGFRGEALPSIAAVSRLLLESLRAGAEIGSRIEVHGGETLRHEPAGLPAGTRVEVQDLFYATPARRKFLKTPAYELQRVQKVLQRCALAYPEVAFRLTHNGKALFFYPRAAHREQRLYAVLGHPWEGRTHYVEEPRLSQAEGVGLAAFFTAPEVSFANSQNQFYFLNRRSFADRSLNHAVSEAYRTLVMDRRYPGVVLFLDMPASEFDVNVHPSKEEVRFRDGAALHRRIVNLLRPALGKLKLDAPAAGLPSTASIAFAPADYTAPLTASEPRAAYTTAPIPQQQPLGFAVQPSGDAANFSGLRLIGQLRDSYIVCEGRGGLVLLDQHAAHERVMFEKLRQRLAQAGGGAQELLEPRLIRLNAAQYKTFERHAETLKAVGFTLEVFGAGASPELLMRTQPDFIAVDAQLLLEDLLHDLEAEGSTLALEHTRDRVLESMACHSAVRFHQQLSVAEMQALLADLDRYAHSTNCPHGRPVYVRFSDAELERLFKRH